MFPRQSTVMLILVAFFCFWQSGRQSDDLLRLRAAYRLDAGQPLENAPPVMVFTTVALGGFSGLLADFMWLRVSYLQDEDRYFELVQLADWITKLEPRCPEVWAFHSWNMAYNITVMMGDPEDRWRWLMSGISLLRDEGLRYNPNNGKLCSELAWVYQFKIGGNSDYQHRFYKKKLAGEMGAILREGRFDFDAAMSSPDTVRRLRSEFRMQPHLMREIDVKYGPLDWRLPEAQAVYWAYLGRRNATGIELLNCERIIYQAMSGMFQRGKLVFKPDGTMMNTPDPAFFQNALKAYESARQRLPSKNMSTAYRNFLEEGMVVMLRLGLRDKAEWIFGMLRENSPDTCAPTFEGHIKSAGFMELSRRIYTEIESPAVPAVEKPAEERWTALGAEACLTVGGADRARISVLAGECRLISRNSEASLTLAKQDSEMSFLNQSAGWAPLEVTPQTLEFLQQAVRLSELSGGAFDITAAPSAALWGLNRNAVIEKAPPDAEIQEARRRVGYRHIVLSNETAFINLADAGVDPGDLVAGYAADACFVKLNGMGVSNFMITVGCATRCSGDTGSGPWTVPVPDLLDGAGITGSIILSNGQAVSRAGGADRSFSVEGQRYLRIIDPRTGYPVKGVAGSVAVSSNAMDAVALGITACVVFPDGVKRAVDKFAGSELLVEPEKRPALIQATRGMTGVFKPDPSFAGKVEVIE